MLKQSSYVSVKLLEFQVQMALVIVRLQDLGLILLLLSLASIGLISASLFSLILPTLNSLHHHYLSNIAILSPSRDSWLS